MPAGPRYSSTRYALELEIGERIATVAGVVRTARGRLCGGGARGAGGRERDFTVKQPIHFTILLYVKNLRKMLTLHPNKVRCRTHYR